MSIDFKKILNNFTSFDKKGSSSKKIDTYLEFYKLSDYLNGNNSENMTAYNELDISQQNKLLELYNNAKCFLEKEFSNSDNLIQIDDNNVKEYKYLYSNLLKKLNWDEMEKGEEKVFDFLQKSLYQYCIAVGYDMLDLKYDECDYNFILERIQHRNQIEAKMVEDSKIVIDKIKNPYNNKKLKNAVSEYIKTNDIKPLNNENYSGDIGNGKFDKIATQKTELCWAHAGINTLLLTDEGKKLIESNTYYDKTTGVFAIHLEEAENYGLHGGIYIITPEEIAKESSQLSEGEGDVTAWMIAIKKYFDELNQNPEILEIVQDDNKIIMAIDEGNAQFRFFELITGGKANRRNLWDETRLQNGIFYGRNDITFDEIADIVNNQKGAVIIVLGGHAISVIGIQGDNLLVQESNNSDQFSKDYFDNEKQQTIFNPIEPINNMKTYKVSKHNFEHYNFGEAVIKWK